MKVVRIFGGLGNQMFQYAFYKALKHRYESVKLDISDFDVELYHNGFELERIFNIKVERCSKQELHKIVIKKQGFLNRISRKIFKREFKRRTEYKDKNLGYDTRVFNIEGDTYYDGYWQCEDYFKDIVDEIKSIFKFKCEMDVVNQQIAKSIINCNSVSLHIRRGDYLKSTKYKEVCGKEYYENAIKYIIENVSDPKFYIFSDDIEWCKKNIKIKKDTYYIDNNSSIDSYKDMYLMSLCKHNIIANSTFSWWGAWLNNYSNKIVVSPKKWSNDTHNKNIIPEKWIKI